MAVELNRVWRWDAAAKEWVRIRLYDGEIGDILAVELENNRLERAVFILEERPTFISDGQSGRWSVEHAIGYVETVPDVNSPTDPPDMELLEKIRKRKIPS